MKPAITKEPRLAQKTGNPAPAPEMPQSGGSYLRLADGTLVPAPAPADSAGPATDADGMPDGMPDATPDTPPGQEA